MCFEKLIEFPFNMFSSQARLLEARNKHIQSCWNFQIQSCYGCDRQLQKAVQVRQFAHDANAESVRGQPEKLIFPAFE
jgi:hypothetical protein